MTPAHIVSRFYQEIVSQNQLHRLAEFVSPACCLWAEGQLVPVGIEGMANHIAATKATYPDYCLRITRQFSCGDYVISQFVMEGTHQGEWLGIEPSGRRLSFSGINVDRVVEGKLVEHSGAVGTFETLWDAGLIGPLHRPDPQEPHP